MKGKHAQKKFGGVGAMAPTPLSLKPRGGGVEGGSGVSHTRTGAGRPPREGTTVCLEIPLQSPPPPGRPSLGNRLPPPPWETVARGGR